MRSRSFFWRSHKRGICLSGVLLIILVAMAGVWSCQGGKSTLSRRVLVIGFDGMDPKILTRLMEEGKVPSFEKLSKMGDFLPLTSSIPPQSPVAWSNFITGMNPGGHGIYDFMHREPDTYLPFLSTSRTEPPKRTLKLGSWVLPLSGGKAELLRRGRAFWQVLEEYDIPATIFRIPSNFPPAESKQRTISGMGTPDILGTYGTFSFYTERPDELSGEITGGAVFPVEVVDNMVKAQLVGPPNTFKEDNPTAVVDFTVYIDPENRVAKVVVQDEEVILKEGEWSRWVRVKFPMLPMLASLKGICRFYLKETRPVFKLYVTPINLDPEDPAMPISTPSSYSKKLSRRVGCFYTQGMPEDTKALDQDVLDDGEFIRQAELVLEERMKAFHYELERFRSGLLFFYFSTLDQGTHMFWRLMDPQHPSYDAQLAEKYGDVVEMLYQKMDEALEVALQYVDENTTLIVMSDHGFAPFYRGFHLNTWLKDNGYVALIDEWRQGETEFFMNTDWDNTRAYALGFNGLYINQAGRERYGIVSPGEEKEALLEELVERLIQVHDPQTGLQVISHVYRTDEVYQGEEMKYAPDLIIGYNWGYRASNETALGAFPRELFRDNTDKWSGDHCMDYIWIPGIILSNKKITYRQPALYDIAPTILAEFGIPLPREMVGRPIF